MSNLPIKGSTDAYCLVAIDLTEHNRMEAIAGSERVARELLAASNQSREELLRVIEEKTRAEGMLREKEHLLSESQHIAHIGGWSWDLVGPIKWTEETYRIYGVSPETFTPTVESLVNLVHPEDRPAMQRWMEDCTAGKRPGDLAFRTILPDGTVRFLDGRGELKHDAGIRPFIVGTVQDITERMRAEERLQGQLEELLRWQDVMLDREDYVRQLKGEVNELRRRLGESARYSSKETDLPDSETAKPDS